MAAGKVLFSVKVTHFSRIELQSEEVFNTEVAHKYLLTHRKVHHCMKMKSKLGVYNNGLKFVPSTMFSGVKSEFYDFNQIHRFFVFKIEPLVLLLCVVVNESRFVSITRFHQENDLNHVCDEIQRIKGGAAIDNVSSTQNVEEEHHIEQQATHVSSSSESYKSQHQEEPIVRQEKETVHREPMKWQTQNDHPLDDCHKRNSTGACDEWDVSEMYIEYDPVKGPRICEGGPIYMFVAQQRHPHYHSIFTCEGSSDGESESSDSGDSLPSRGKTYYPTGTGGRKLSRQWAANVAPVQQALPMFAMEPTEFPEEKSPNHRDSVTEEKVVPLDRRAISTSKMPSSVIHLPEYHRYSLIEQNGIRDEEFGLEGHAAHPSKHLGGSQNEISFTYRA